MELFPYPRAFVDWEVPLREDGTPILGFSREGDFERYVEWLADYLYEKDIPIPECQRGVLEEEGKWAIFDIGDNYSIQDQILRIEMSMRSGETFEDFRKEELSVYGSPEWQELFEEEGGSIEDMLITREQYERVVRETEEWHKIPGSVDLSDIPYRALLAQEIKKIPDRAERIKELTFYFDNIFENWAK